MIKKMGTAFFILRMEDIMKENGKTIKCTALESFIMKMARLLMKDIGIMMNLMGKAESTTPSQLYLTSSSIIKISLSLAINGHTIRDSLKTILSMEKAILN